MLNYNLNYSFIGLKSPIDHIINDLRNKKDIIYANNQLRNIILIINNISEDIKRVNNILNKIKYNYIENDSIKKNKINSLNNEIICIYNMKGNEINFLHDYNENIEKWNERYKKSYLEGKNSIIEKNIEIYINKKKKKFWL